MIMTIFHWYYDFTYILIVLATPIILRSFISYILGYILSYTPTTYSTILTIVHFDSISTLSLYNI